MATLLERQTDFQLITLEGSDGGMKLYLDGFYQFDTATEGCYHGFIASFPLAMHGNAQRVLILGGGDGLALRDVLEFPVVEVFLVELDPGMIKFATEAPMTDLNRGAFGDSRAKVIISDALEAISKFPNGYFDVIIADFPAATSDELKKLYEPAFYEKIFTKLAPGGIFVSQVSEELSFTRELRKFLEATLGHGMTLIAQPKKSENQPFVYGSSHPFAMRSAVPGGSPISGAIPGISAELEAGRKVIVYTPRKKVYCGPRIA